jgi:hypothetical protein
MTSYLSRASCRSGLIPAAGPRTFSSQKKICRQLLRELVAQAGGKLQHCVKPDPN